MSTGLHLLGVGGYLATFIPCPYFPTSWHLREFSQPPGSRQIYQLLHAVILSSTDVVCLGFMSWANRNMVLTLHRHKQQTLTQIFPWGQSLRYYPDPSKRLCLLYRPSSILTLCNTLIVNPNQWLMDTTVLTPSCFPAFSTFVFISSDTRVSKFFLDLYTREKKVP